MLTEDQLQKMVEVFGDKLPDPEHNPIQFAFYIKLFKKLEEWKAV